jgi:hypothetical protein
MFCLSLAETAGPGVTRQAIKARGLVYRDTADTVLN